MSARYVPNSHLYGCTRSTCTGCVADPFRGDDMSTETPRPERVTPEPTFAERVNARNLEQIAERLVTLTDEERDAIHHAGDIHHPDHCDCSAYVVEAGFQEDDCCAGLLDTFDAVEGILAAREQALREEIARQIEAEAYPFRALYDPDGHRATLHAASIVRGETR